MTNKNLLDLYSDYLISSFGQTTATGLSALLNGTISHDRVQRFSAGEQQTAADLWRVVKPHVRAIESQEGALIVDDSIAEKPYADENDIICWRYDHSRQRHVKGINFMTCLHHDDGIPLPVGFELIAKTEQHADRESGMEKRRPPATRNELCRSMLQQAACNQIQFQYVLNNVWSASAENMNFATATLKKNFVMPLKSSRKAALSSSAKKNGRRLL